MIYNLLLILLHKADFIDFFQLFTEALFRF